MVPVSFHSITKHSQGNFRERPGHNISVYIALLPHNCLALVSSQLLVKCNLAALVHKSAHDSCMLILYYLLHLHVTLDKSNWQINMHVSIELACGDFLFLTDKSLSYY